ncbi:hypothetical protein NECAME_10851 [Necator americanus]|uniref:Phospholipase/carboxylesterase/thioesterase domain-containing protein n=1 Tax=Necator americanus TaxID=51031 RepID=W2T837_NECAM|nr:hypothetical protein NECAME_10851 [Necator americanus]ETN77759.1 hypothetical protein NECAME_10851 [Necator americanus]
MLGAQGKSLSSRLQMEHQQRKKILGGFFMGEALALYAGLIYYHRLGGIVGLSSFLIQRDKLPGLKLDKLQRF